MQINGLEVRELLFEIRFRELNALRWKGKSFVEREGISDGVTLCTSADGIGRKTLTHAFSGCGTDVIPQYSSTVEFNPKPEWSNGTDTKDIESKLRRAKKKLHYTEVETHKHGGKRRGAGRPTNG